VVCVESRGRYPHARLCRARMARMLDLDASARICRAIMLSTLVNRRHRYFNMAMNYIVLGRFTEYIGYDMTSIN